MSFPGKHFRRAKEVASVATVAFALHGMAGPEIGQTLAAPSQSDGGIPAASARDASSGQVDSAPASPAPAPPDATFKRDLATIYGPGLWNNRTACGQVLTKRIVGVAHSTLSCGTKVALSYNGKRLTVHVIDKLPEGSQAEWDLTAATAKRLGLKSTDEVGAAVL